MIEAKTPVDSSASNRRWNIALRLSIGFVLVAGTFLLAPTADAACRNPGQTCGILGGSCCSGSSCFGVCVSNCAGEGGLCATSSNCCGSNRCALGFCQRPRNRGEGCGPGFPCSSGLVCDPVAGFVCVTQGVGAGGACGPLVQCASGLVCDPASGFRCVNDTAGLGEGCGPLVPCEDGLFCDPASGFTCVNDTAGIGEGCGLLVPCEDGLFCDPISGFTCVEQTASLGQGCGPAVPCEAGLACDPISGFVCVENSATQDEACGPLVRCDAGFFCDPFAGDRCVAAAGVDQACGPGVPCSNGLTCTSAFRCAHNPSLAGEACGLGFGCDDGLYCQAGLPSRCQALRKPGEGCSAFNPCDDGLSCEACFVNGCSAPFQCFTDRNQGAITEQQCRKLYHAPLQEAAQDTGLAMTYSAGDGIAALLGESQAFGVAYGADGRYGCFTSLCGGINADVGIEAFAAVGFYETFDDIGGSSFANFQEAQTPLNALNFSTSQIFLRNEGEILPLPILIGTEDALSIGIGPTILPVSAGSFLCTTVLDTVIDPNVAPPPPSLAVAKAMAPNSSFTSTIAGWTCVDGTCSWTSDDATGSVGSGSAQVTSPTQGAAIGRIASDCIGVMPGQPHSIKAWAKTLGALPGSFEADWRPGLNCEGEPLRIDILDESPPDGSWRLLDRVVQAPMGAQSLVVSMSAERDAVTSALSTSQIDVLQVPEPNAIVLGLPALLSLACVRRRRRG